MPFVVGNIKELLTKDASGILNGDYIIKIGTVSFEGGFKKGLLQGQGKFNIFDSEDDELPIISYEGQFKEGHMCGFGKTIVNGYNYYEGDYEDDTITGFGTI